MYRLKTVLKIALLSLGLFFAFSAHVSAEVIRSFDAQITVNTDNSVSVVETILYDSEGLQKHGIYRDITPRSSEGKTMSINSISVVDSVGRPYQWHREINNGDVRLKIGDPNITFVGEKTYVISYVATNAVAHLDDVDEIYWNATGNAWPFAIEKATSTVILPEGATSTQAVCYEGMNGSTEECSTELGIFQSTRTLNPGEGMTVATGFPQGFVSLYAPQSFLERYGLKLLAILIPILVFFIQFFRWCKKGRDPKGHGIIIPQYDVPDGLTPLESATIVFQKPRSVDISAELIYLATKGYIKIQQVDAKKAFFMQSPDYDLILLKEIAGIEVEHDLVLLGQIFTDSRIGSEVRISTLKSTFYTAIPRINKTVGNTMLRKEYYTNLPFIKQQDTSWVVIKLFSLFVLLGASRFILPILFKNVSLVEYFILTGSVIVSITCIIFFERLMPAKTQKGVAAYEHLLGLKDYLQIAEKDRLAFHNAPSKKPEIFEQLLPYALVLGVEKSWAKEFKDLYTVSPSWYEGIYHERFNSLLFVDSLTHFGTVATSSFASASSGGSRGGGFSGGGGGGGGGGSW